MKKAIFLGLFLALNQTADAGVYTWVMPDGSVVFSDQPQADTAKKVEPGPVNSMNPHVLVDYATKSGELGPSELDSDSSYISFGITRPLHDQAFRAANGNVTIELKVEPELKQNDGHHIWVYMDGQPVFGPTYQTSITLENVDRGTHQVWATLFDASGNKQMESYSITFHLLR